jgi:hypothetical protein
VYEIIAVFNKEKGCADSRISPVSTPIHMKIPGNLIQTECSFGAVFK